jgi:uncharacterized protein
MANRLSSEKSPYLLQHANNPVDWYPWSVEAFERAEIEDKPILVSIGYSTCHWCHVMERESFEDHSVAAFMNENFINIKIDREEYPEIDQIYMQAVQLLTGGGGWPLNCFLLPDRRPFYGGTYYPPSPAYNRPSWLQLLHHIRKIFSEKRQVAEDQATRLTELIEKGDNKFVKEVNLLEGKNADSPDFLWEEFTGKVLDQLDTEWGGFSGSPKFPSMPSFYLCLELSYYLKSERLRDHVLFTMDKMMTGGIHDVVGGGFARYATDRQWRIPHFEKMLYDNAQILQALAWLFQVSQEDRYYLCAKNLYHFLDREMKDTCGLYFAALDADSEGEEGKFYTYTYDELEKAVEGFNSGEILDFYNADQAGNWEEKNILFSDQLPEDYAESKGINASDWQKQLQAFHERLLKLREKRIRPGLDHKILLSWNALLAESFFCWQDALGIKSDIFSGEKLLEGLLREFLSDDYRLLRIKTNEEVYLPGNLDDYAYMISALIQGFQSTSKQKYLDIAVELNIRVKELFFDEEDEMYFFSSIDNDTVPVRVKDIFDHALPCAAAVMCLNKWKLGILTGNQKMKEKSIQMQKRLQESVMKFPSAMASWARAGLQMNFPFYEVEATGYDRDKILTEIKKAYLPNKLFVKRVIHMFEDQGAMPDVAAILICSDNTCELPVTEVSESIERLKRIH